MTPSLTTLPAPPSAPHDPAPVRSMAIVTCMDARIDPLEVLGCQLGDAHVIRSLGGRVTDEVLAALAISCAVFGTRDIVVMHHADCGLHHREQELRDAVAAVAEPLPEDQHLPVVHDPKESLASDVHRVESCPHLPDAIVARGVYLELGS